MPEITGLNTGGSDITSYALYWNMGSGTVFYEIIGETVDNLVRFAFQDNLVNGNAYSF